ncbi:MAG: PAS domain S-box protein [Candidatus Zixiibacteriota bacterium]
MSQSQRAPISKTVENNDHRGRRHNPLWLHLFFVMAILSGIVSTTTYVGDRSLEKRVDRFEEFQAKWSTWRLVEDSIRFELDHVGIYLGVDTVFHRLDGATNNMRQRVEIIRRCIAHLQISDIPNTSKEVSKPIYDAIATLSVAGDNLAAVVTDLSTIPSAPVPKYTFDNHKRAATSYAAIVRALNSVRNSRIQIVDDLNREFNSSFKSWQSLEEFVNTAALILLAVLIGIGVLIARKYARSESDRARQFAQLHESESRFRSVVANVPGIIFRSRIAKDWPIEFISENVERITGYPASDFIGNRVRRFGSLIHPADGDRMIDAVSRSIEFGTPYALEYRLIKSNGAIVWVAEHGQAVAGDNGKPQWLDGAILDITDRKQAADDLAQSEETLRALIDASPGIALLLDGDGRILAANEAMARNVGISREDLVGMLGYEIVTPERMQPGWQHFRDVVELGKKIDFIQEFEGAYTHVYLCPIFDARGNVVRVAAFGQDITDWKLALNESARFQNILDSTPDIVGIINTNYEFIYMNRANREFLELHDEDTLTKLDFSRVYTPDSLRFFHEVAMPAVYRDGIWQGEVTMVTHEGKEMPVSIVMMAHRSSSGEVEFLSCIIRDMSDRKHAEEALARSERHLRLMTAGVPGVLYQFKFNDDGSMCFTYVSDGANAIFGVDAEAIMLDASCIFRVLHPDDAEMALASVERNPNANSIWRKEFRCFVNGEVRWVSGSALPQEQPDGTFVWNGMLIDITAQKMAEEQLRISEERFRRIFAAAGFGMATTDLQGNLKESNRAFQEMIQYSGEELRGMNFADFTHPDDANLVQESLPEVPNDSDQPQIQCEKRYIRKDGSVLWARISVIEFKGEAGQSGYYIGTVEDITARKQSDEKIRESEVLYRTIFKSSGEGLLLMTDSFIDCNERAAEIWKCKRSDICGKSPLDFSPEFQPDGSRSVDKLHEYLTYALEGNFKCFNWRHLRLDGVEIDTEVSLTSVMIAGSTLLLATVRDISERVQIEQELRESLIQLHTLVESAVDGIVIFAQDGAIESVNPAAEKIFDVEANSLVGTSIIDLIAEPHGSRYLKLLRRHDSEYSSSLLRGVHEVLGLRLGGYVFPMDLAISPLKLGADLKFVAIIRDISERRLAEQQILENEARLEAILSSAGDGIIVIDSERLIQVVNKAAQEIFGFAAKELVGRSVGEIIQGIDEKPLPIQGERSVFDSIGFNQIRGEVPLQVSVSRVTIGGADSYAVIARDMTEEYNRRERLIEADKLTSIGTLAAGIAHEFKNYLAGIIGNASFALDGLDEPDGISEARDAFEQIISIGEKADGIASSLLTYSRRRESDLELLDLRELINSTLRFTGKELAEKNIVVLTEFEDVPKVMVSASRVQQVFLNLIINASQAILERGKIEIRIEKSADDVLVRISDNGIGISAENLRRIFDPFFSTKGVWGKDAVQGTGLGLSVCRNIVNSFGGEISAESAIGRGSTFTISLPIPEQQPAKVYESTTVTINSILLISTNSDIENAYSLASQSIGFECRFLRSQNFAGSAQSIGRGTLVVIDCSSPNLADLIRVIELCNDKLVRLAYINKVQSAKELRPFIPDDSVSFERVPELSELISGLIPART